ncbi:DUF4140 domain-containing protein [Escherichia fergusonii]|nr:DUF4140 domain-containing protein [Escherichia fergusonii]MCZ5215101.1 DUF4140 domain-containing protein [Escherichia fergusonii]
MPIVKDNHVDFKTPSPRDAACRLYVLCLGAQLTQPLTLKDVTVYLHGASLQGVETLNLPTGESEIIFTNIANSVTPDSIAIAMDNGVTVLSSRLALQETPSQALLSDVQQQLKAARLEQAKLTAEKDNIAAQVKVLEANNTLTQKMLLKSASICKW